MTKYEVRIDVYFSDKTKADNLYKYLEGLKSDLIKFDDAESNTQISKVDLIKNEHDGETFSPCTLLKSFENELTTDSFKTIDNTGEK